MKVVVVGGGLAGISAALTLADCGMEVELLEARRRLGGRVGSFYDEQSQQFVDYCQHVGMECCSALQWFLERVEQREQWAVQDTLHFYDASGRHCPVRGLPLPAPLHLAGMLWQWPGLSWGERFRLSCGLIRLIATKNFPDEPIGCWLLRHQQTKGIVTNFWEPILVSALGETMGGISLKSAHQVLVEGFAATRTGYRLWVPRRPLSELMNSHTQSILERDRVRVHLQTPVVKIEHTSQGGIRVQLKDRLVEADHVVMAVPWHQVRRIAPDWLSGEDEYPDDILVPSPITGVHTWWDRAWLPTPHAILTGRLCQWIFPAPEGAEGITSVANGEEQGTYYQIVISGSRQLEGVSHAEVLAQIEAELRSLFPSCREAKCLRGRVVTDPNAVFRTPIFSEDARWKHDRFAERHLWVCGDWTETGWPATMEGAIRSGRTVAQAIAQHDSSSSQHRFTRKVHS